MNRMIRLILAVFFVAVIMFSAINICQNLGKNWRLDITEEKLYTLSDGTKAILAKLNQPIRMKLYYTKTAAMKGPDQIRFYNTYYNFVKALLEEYEAQAKGMIDFELVDPRPYSDDEVAAIRYGLKRFSITEEENFFFGLVVQTQFGVEKIIDFFSPDRQKFVEYDISYLIDTAITRQKKRIGILSALPVMGDDVTGYMAQMMMMQGQKPQPAWGIVRQLKQKYEVSQISTDVEKIEDVDILLVIHPKAFSEKTQFAVEQFLLQGGRAIICVDPHCVADPPDRSQMQFGQMHPTDSNMEKLFSSWGLEVPKNTFAGDGNLAVIGTTRPNQRPEKIISIMQLKGDDCFNRDKVVTGKLNNVSMMFSGVIEQTVSTNESQVQPNMNITPLVTTTAEGNSWTISSPYEITNPNYAALLKKFTPGTKPVDLACLITGKFKSSFPEGIEVPVETDEQQPPEDEESDVSDEPKTKIITGLTESQAECAAVVFADVDFISDMMAYRDTFFGTAVVGDNSSLLINAVEDLAGSGDLISIRSRGSFTREFTRVKNIEQKAEAETAEEEASINAEIAGFQQQLQEVVSQAKQGDEQIIETAILQKKKEVEAKIRDRERQLRIVKMQKVQQIEKLGNRLRNFCTLPGPALTLIIAIVLGIRRGVMRRYYISHTSDS